LVDLFELITLVGFGIFTVMKFHVVVFGHQGS